MSEPGQVAAFEEALRKVIQRFRAEYDLTLGSAIGTLESVKLELWLEQQKQREGE